MRAYFLKTERIGFSKWTDHDLILCNQLWKDEAVTRYISKNGMFTTDDIKNRLETEIQNEQLFQVQYWPIFELTTNEFIGCCGIRPSDIAEDSFELGFHLCKKHWGKGYAFEAATAVIEYSFNRLKINELFAGHHPENEASRNLILKLGFLFINDSYYEPTGLYHPSYVLRSNQR
ncbi:acetyltransferase [Erysipelothrix larvae]|uniref:Acetyltransferase n=1 Tax=Erysipelothrix larvae TaxID=1514105 RepID=A0A109UGE3_9FIRM|nr:GNAT family N-acetyltransferase [Erysipelothrix larvae]AMC92437.1 acetyltransferase [Erysipelothrix larvae]